jgi:hypothetical protein
MTRESLLLNPKETTCSRCPWSIAVETDAEKQRRESVHASSAHGIKAPVVERHLTGLSWQEAAVDAVRAVAARGGKFQLHEALTEFGIADPPDARTALGKFATLLHDLGIVHPCGFAPSTRPGTKKSALRVWSQSAAGCQECARKRTA